MAIREYLSLYCLGQADRVKLVFGLMDWDGLDRVGRHQTIYDNPFFQKLRWVSDNESLINMYSSLVTK